MNIEKPNFIEKVLEVLELRSCENGTLEHKNGKKEKLNFNGKFFVKNLDFNTTNPINSIPLKFNWTLWIKSLLQLYSKIRCFLKI